MDSTGLKAEVQGELVRVYPFPNYYFEIDKEKLSFAHIEEGQLMVDGKKATKLSFLLEDGLKHLVNMVTKRPTVFIDESIPLLGSSYFGLIDRNSSLIELRASTGCNLNCVFCSVDEGLASKKLSDFLVERTHLVAEFEKLAKFKGVPVEAQLNSQGEPTLYPWTAELVEDLVKVPGVETVSLITNGTLLNEQFIDRLAAAGLGRLNLSLNAIDSEVGARLADAPYNIERVKEMARYAAGKLNLIINPVWVKGMNDDQMEKIVRFALEIGAGNGGPPVGIQNFLSYSRGRNPAKQSSWEEFDKMLCRLEASTGAKLHLDEKDFKIVKTRSLPKPFRKGQTIQAVVACRGRFPKEAIAVSDERCIHVTGCDTAVGEKVRIKLLSDKHNLFFGKKV